jgi:hypothetical protein
MINMMLSQNFVYLYADVMRRKIYWQFEGRDPIRSDALFVGVTAV